VLLERVRQPVSRKVSGNVLPRIVHRSQDAPFPLAGCLRRRRTAPTAGPGIDFS
jgi:hypothetical protein